MVVQKGALAAALTPAVADFPHRVRNVPVVRDTLVVAAEDNLAIVEGSPAEDGNRRLDLAVGSFQGTNR